MAIHPRVFARCAALNIESRDHASVAVTAKIVSAANAAFVMEVVQVGEMTRQFFSAEVDARLDHVARALKPLPEISCGGMAPPHDDRESEGARLADDRASFVELPRTGRG
jgi:hypothetical protein